MIRFDSIGFPSTDVELERAKRKVTQRHSKMQEHSVELSYSMME